MTNKTRTNKAHGMGWNKPDELRDKVEAWYEESFEIDLKAARNNWPDKRCGADDAIDALLKLVAAHTTKAVEEARHKEAQLYLDNLRSLKMIDGQEPEFKVIVREAENRVKFWANHNTAPHPAQEKQ